MTAWLPAVGVDLVKVGAVQQALSQHGDRYLNRLYTVGEIEYSRLSTSEMPRRLAARFAAKEATLKILRPVGHWLDWRLIEVIRSEHGHCGMALHGAAASLAEQRGIRALAVSLSHEDDMAIAVVMGMQCQP